MSGFDEARPVQACEPSGALASPPFIVGAGRSGTTWLQIMLGRHPAVATTTETHSIAGYPSWMERRWRRERQHRAHGGDIGIAHCSARNSFMRRCAGSPVTSWRG